MNLSNQTCILLALAPFGAAFAEDFSDAERLFTLKIQPLFSEKCNGCHGDDPDDIKGKFSMLTRQQLLAGGETFGTDTLVPGDPAKSLIMDAIRWDYEDFEMPPKENDRLTAEQIEEVAAWITAGAPWPSDERMAAIREIESQKLVTDEGMIVQTSGGQGDEWTYRRYKPEDIWAFQPVVRPKVPAGAENPVDAFLQTKLAELDFKPAPQADPLTLIRRATFDLTGLPPKPEEISEFQKAWKSDPEAAWTALIDRLLESPRYGERWGQHWLDVARYADTGGYSNDYERSNAWRYRDYVIRAFNEDKPYDKFVIEQLAGDELADHSAQKRGEEGWRARRDGTYTPEEAELIIATGFLRMGPYDNAMVKEAEARQIYLDDVVNSIGQTFLATTMRCFKCHDHKFDPLPTRDYYRMYAALSTTFMAERNVPFLPEENLEGLEEGKKFVEGMLEFARVEKTKLTDKREAAARAWFEENNLEYVAHADRKELPDDVKPPRHVGLDYVEQGQLKVREQDEWVWERRLERYQPMTQSVFNSMAGKQGGARKMRIAHKPNHQEAEMKNHILMGGALAAQGEEVTPGVLSALGLAVEGAPEDDPWALPKTAWNRRFALAKWIAHPDNPLTARAFINRVWQHHFSQPLAANPNNFGVKGGKPSHPQLLDWLAADFVENGWTLKRIHRLIMTSDAYKMSGEHPQLEYLEAKDPDNRLLAYFPARRLTAEEFRDSLLQITGELNTSIGGLPAKPEINMEVALQPRMIQFSIAPAYQPHPKPEDRNRRTIYAYRVRGMADPFLEIFNQPNPNDSCEFRDSAAVTPQAFTLLNSDTVTDRSIAFAQQLQETQPNLDGQIQAAFSRTLGRNPDSDELERMKNYVTEMRTYHAEQGVQPVSYPTQITRSLVEEFSGKEFEYEEILPNFENYQPDAKAADVDAETRALADLCLLLFNANEFAYIY